MFQEQLKELVELGKGFVSAMNTLTRAVAEESKKQIDIIQQAQHDLGVATQVQSGIVDIIDNMSNAMDDIYIYADETVSANNIILDHLDEAFVELTANEDEEDGNE